MYFGAKEKNAVTLPYSSQRKHTCLVEIKEMTKTKKLPAGKKIALELLHQILGHRSTISFSASSKLTNWILDSGATCHRTPEVSNFIPGSLEYMDRHIEVADGHHVTAKQEGQVQIKICDNHVDTFIATLQVYLCHTFIH